MNVKTEVSPDDQEALYRAAPEMLQALKEAAVDYRDSGMGDRQIVTVIKAAIAHAEGRA